MSDKTQTTNSHERAACAAFDRSDRAGFMAAVDAISRYALAVIAESQRLRCENARLKAQLEECK